MYNFVCPVIFIVQVLYKDKGFIQMHRFEDLICPKATKYLGLFVDALILLFLIYLVPYTRSLNLNQTELLSKGLGIPRIYVTIPVPVAVFMALLVSVSHISHQIKDLRLRESNDHP